MKSMNPHIPAEAVLKYVVRQRDEALNKLEQLTGYAEALEFQVEDLTKENKRLEEALNKRRTMDNVARTTLRMVVDETLAAMRVIK